MECGGRLLYDSCVVPLGLEKAGFAVGRSQGGIDFEGKDIKRGGVLKLKYSRSASELALREG
jgi:hypothetical protein